MQAKKSNQITIKLDGQPLPQAKPSRLPIQPIKPALAEQQEKTQHQTMPAFEDTKMPANPVPAPVAIPHDDDAMQRLSAIRQARESRAVEAFHKPELVEAEVLPSDIRVAENIETNDIQQGPLWEEEDEPKRGKVAAFFGNKYRVLWKKPGMKMLITVTGAVVVGLHFGFLVLAVFMNEQLSQSYRTVLDGTVQTLAAVQGNVQQNTQQNGQSTAAGTHAPPVAGEASKGAIGSQEIQVTLPDQRLFIAQGGVFSDQKAADQAIKPLVDKQLPHMYFEDGQKRYLYLAAATSRDQILGLASQLKAIGQDVYIKEVSFPGINKWLTFQAQPTVAGIQPASSVNPADAQEFLLTGFELARTLADWSGQMMRDGKVVKLPADADAKLTEQHRKLLEQKKSFVQIMPEAAHQDLESMVNGITQAVTAYAQVKNPNAESYAWQAQKGVLQFVESYLQFVKKIQP
ncbi:hypothetical protein EDM56_08675 [Brevibacillus fluminis]|uniref:SPOR domain-containing protein n=1 Tax=Brevibacillus fluminis TaxID=511487 RepID=A0A3M8DUC3_9BACL|nr:hypothetical protein [Brevibacillus fluminis]RNB90567.1 hypothetical protein EDM56_08675 [Brevibacillus fluminis]